MTKEKIEEAYELARHLNATQEEAVQIGLSMAINGEVLLDSNNKIIKIE